MARPSLFSKERVVYWPSEFLSVANLLKGQNEKGQLVAPPLYTFNTGIMVLAATLGVQHKRKREVGGQRQEISTATFASHGLDAYILLIPLLGNAGLSIDALRPDNEEELIREFERFAAGGFEVLRGLFDESAGKSGELILQQEMNRLLGKEEEAPQSGRPMLF